MIARIYLLVLWVAAMPVVSGAADGQACHKAVPAHLKEGDYFEGISVTATNITIKFKSSGQRYFYRRGNGGLIKTEYGSELTIATGESVTIIGRDDNVTFLPLPDEVKSCGFDVREEHDQRSIGKTLTIDRVFMVISCVTGIKEIRDADVFYGEPTIASIQGYLKRQTSDR